MSADRSNALARFRAGQPAPRVFDVIATAPGNGATYGIALASAADAIIYAARLTALGYTVDDPFEITGKSLADALTEAADYFRDDRLSPENRT